MAAPIFIFGGDTGVATPQQLKRLRSIAEALNANSRAPKNIGEGLNAIGEALIYRSVAGRADDMEKKGLESAKASMNPIIDALGGGIAPSMGPSPDKVGAALIGQPEVAKELAATDPTPASFSGDQQEFIESILPAAIEEGKRTGVDPRIIVAQAAQETGWGRSAPGNNLFGIKSHGQSGGNSLMTTEYVDGRPVKMRDSFRAYENPAESVRGYGDFILQNPRYEKFRTAQGLDEQLAALQASGYATDPNYSRSVGRIARGIQLPGEVASLDPSAGMPTAGAAIDAVAPPSGQPLAGPAPYRDPVISAPNYQPPAAGPQQAAVAPQQAPGALPPLPARDVGPVPNVAAVPQQAASAPVQMAQAQQRGPSLQQLYQALENPWLNEAQQRLILGEIQRQQQEADPVRQMQLRKGQLEIEAAERGNWARLDDGRLYNQRTGEIKSLPGAGADQEEWGLTPVWGKDKNGKTVLGQVSKSGKFKPLDTGEFQPTPGISNQDVGTAIITRDNRTGEVIATTPKENYREAFDTEAGKVGGKAQGEAQAGVAQAVADADYSISLIDEMLTHPGRGTATGLSSVLDPRNYLPGTDATDFNTRRRQLEGRAFLQAFNSLRGGGQITEQEGKKATEALARLNTAQSDEAFKEALTELKGILELGKDRARQKAGSGQTPSSSGGAAQSAPTPSAADPLGLR